MSDDENGSDQNQTFVFKANEYNITFSKAYISLKYVVQSSGFLKADPFSRTGHFENIDTVSYHSGGSMELNACILLLAHMVYL
jgi:hypothetical protein